MASGLEERVALWAGIETEGARLGFFLYCQVRGEQITHVFGSGHPLCGDDPRAPVQHRSGKILVCLPEPFNGPSILRLALDTLELFCDRFTVEERDQTDASARVLAHLVCETEVRA